MKQGHKIRRNGIQKAVGPEKERDDMREVSDQQQKDKSCVTGVEGKQFTMEQNRGLGETFQKDKTGKRADLSEHLERKFKER